MPSGRKWGECSGVAALHGHKERGRADHGNSGKLAELQGLPKDEEAEERGHGRLKAHEHTEDLRRNKAQGNDFQPVRQCRSKEAHKELFNGLSERISALENGGGGAVKGVVYIHQQAAWAMVDYGDNFYITTEDGHNILFDTMEAFEENCYVVPVLYNEDWYAYEYEGDVIVWREREDAEVYITGGEIWGGDMFISEYEFEFTAPEPVFIEP